MKKTLITGLVAFSLLATIGIAMAGQSEIGIKTYTQRGEVEGSFCINPQYLQYDTHSFTYCSEFDTEDWAEDVNTFTYTSVPAAPTDEDMPETVFYQHIDVDEIGVGGCGPKYSSYLFIEDIASDGVQDDALHYLELDVEDTGDAVMCDPPGASQSKDMDVTTTWVSNGASYLAMTQDIYVENKGHCFGGGNNDWDFWPDAVADLTSSNTYGGDYTYNMDIWGKGIEYEFDWLIGDVESTAT